RAWGSGRGAALRTPAGGRGPPPPRRTIQEHDAARRIMFAARADGGLPKDYGDALLATHDRRPFPNAPREIAEFAAQVKDDNFRIEVAEDGIHVYNRNGHHVARDAMSLYPKLGIGSDGAHAFYLGTELMKAGIAWRLGKRYAQGAPLAWGCAVDQPSEDPTQPSPAGPPLPSPRVTRCTDAPTPRIPRYHQRSNWPRPYGADWPDRGRRRLDHRAVPPVEDTRQFARRTLCGGELYR